MTSCEKPPSGHTPSTPEDVPGKGMTTSTTILDKGASIMQSFKPIKQINQHVCTFAFYSHDMKRQIETHHYVAHLNEDVHQCLVFDTDDSSARLIGVEYIVSARVFDTLPQEEKQLWHSHTYEIKAGLWVHPGVPEAVQKEELKKLAKTYGKFWCTWQFDRGDRLPLGPPALMMSPQPEWPVEQGLKDARDKKYAISSDEKADARKDIEGLTEVDPKADYWKTKGKGWAVVIKETDMSLPGPSPSSLLA